MTKEEFRKFLQGDEVAKLNAILKDAKETIEQAQKVVFELQKARTFLQEDLNQVRSKDQRGE